MRPIDGDALIKALVRKEPFSDCARVVIAECMEEVRHASTIELSVQPEIIRCKDCMHRPIKKDGEIVPPKENDWKCPCLCDDYYYSWIPRDDFFCANGERSKEW